MCSRHALCSVGGFADQVLKVAKKIQGALPIVGLISRITSTDGGFDELVRPACSKVAPGHATRTLSGLPALLTTGILGMANFSL